MRLDGSRRVLIAALILTSFVTAVLPAEGAQTNAPPALRILVLPAEGAVNVVEQKTAGAPVVEVRDRNDQPVAGVLLVFRVNGGRAAFAGGQQSVSLTTNAAGRAQAPSLSPTASGAVQIAVTATFQGLTATTTITQTNVLTGTAGTAGTAGSTGAAAGAAATGAAATGGGLSTIALVGIIAGGGVGAFGASRALGGSDDSPGGNNTQQCSVTLSPPTQTAAASGGAFTLNLSTSCAWTATSDASWLAITSPASGSTGQSINGTVAALAGSTRTGRITVTASDGVSAQATITQAVPANVVVIVNPNPVPFSGVPSGACQAGPLTWIQSNTFTETTGTRVDFNRRQDTVGASVQQQTISITVPAGGVVNQTQGWCGSNPAGFTAQSTFFGTDANGNPVTAVGPVVTFLPSP